MIVRTLARTGTVRNVRRNKNYNFVWANSRGGREITRSPVIAQLFVSSLWIINLFADKL